jgi:hypothetical protein
MKYSSYQGITEKTKKIMLFEYIVHTVISVFIIFFLTIKLGIKCYNFAKNEYHFNINGLEEGYSFFGGHRDLSDYQYRNYRSWFSYIVIAAIVSVTIGKIIKTFLREKALKIYYLIFGLGFAFYLHRFKLLYLIIVLLVPYLFTFFYKQIGRNIFIILTWVYVIAIKVTSEIY